MRKVHKQLTVEQKARGVIFTSTLLPDDSPRIHEVLAGDKDKNEVIARLLNDDFFNNSHWKYNEIRT